MSVTSFFQRRLIVDRVTRCLTGRPEDLRRLSGLSRTPVGSPGLNAFLLGLEKDIDAGSGLAPLFLRLGKTAGRRSKRKLVENFIFNSSVRGLERRMKLCSQDLWVPTFFTISPTMRCNLNCRGCYSGLYARDGELSEAEIDRILWEARELGIYFIVVSGGEPFLMKAAWLRLWRKYNDMYFLTYTNATLIDAGTARHLSRLGNVAPAVSVEGFRAETDERRGPGVYARIDRALENLRRERVIFGISVTVTRHNLYVITADRFIEHYINKGAIFGWYFMFMPVGKDPILDMVPTPEQRVYCGERVADLRRRYPIFLADFWNDGPGAGGCLAGGRQYLHILNSGRVEPCVFAHFGVDNIREKPLLECANSPFFRHIRERFPFNENGNLKRPCMIIDNPQVLREAVERYVVPQGHEHSEDIIRDPGVVRWIDDYAARFRELTDPPWEEMINDPNNRWYREKQEYKSLFRFQKPGRPEAVPAAGEKVSREVPV